MKYCSECGTKLIEKECEIDGLVPYCPTCKQFRFLMFNSAISTIIFNPTKDKILLIKQYGKDFNVLVAGYIIKGENELDGDKGLCFVRERYNLPSGDYDRGRNQQKLLKAMLNKAMSPKIITNFQRILTAIEGCFETNMSSDEIKSYATR